MATFATSDLELRSTHTRFSTETFTVGDEVRVYATIRNSGDEDTTGYVAFYHADDLLGRSQVVTVVSGGNDEEVWADFTVPSDSFNIFIQIDSTTPEDSDTSNNSYLTPLYTPIFDQDGDGVDDDDDNCPTVSNANQTDSDGDGEGDVCDDDDDNDGIDDDVEDELGTDPLDKDSDGDGVPDASDAYPTDASRSELEVAEEVEEIAVEEAAEEVVVEVEEVEVSDESVDAVEELEVVEETTSVDTTLLERSSGAVLNVSPDSSFVYVRRDWKTYEFEALTPEGSYDSLKWDFGDGTSSVQRTISHTFLNAGRYTVSLTVSDAQGVTTVDSQVITISLFHLANPMIQMLIGILLILLILSSVALRKAHRAAESVQTNVVKPAEVSAPKKRVVKKRTVKKKVVTKKKTPVKKRVTKKTPKKK